MSVHVFTQAFIPREQTDEDNAMGPPEQKSEALNKHLRS